MQWFKNISLYQITQPIDLSSLESHLQAYSFTPCAHAEQSKIGWVSPFGSTSIVLSQQLNGQILLCMQQEDKILPRFVINDVFKKRIQQLEEQQKKISASEKNAIKDQITIELLSRAFSRYRTTALWIDPIKQRIIIDTSSDARADAILNLLRKTLNSLSVKPLKSHIPPEKTMTQWIQQMELPESLSLLNEIELKNLADNSSIKGKQQNIFSDEIQQHIMAGKCVTQLALNWQDKLDFILAQDLKLKRLKFALPSDTVEQESAPQSIEAQRDSDFYLLSSELTLLIDELCHWINIS